MPLGSVLNTALSGLAAAESMLDAAAHNMANVRTPGFTPLRPMFATQTSRTIDPGAAPTDASGGSNPVQRGRGVMALGTEPVSDEPPADSGGMSTQVMIDSLLDLNAASTQFRINLPVMSETDRLLDELMNIGRPA
ncbi:MAG: hypothetical protein JW809_15740 [Pirellulales bacterium]|nr:hypothetical protein [Pirellulales bacterium]